LARRKLLDVVLPVSYGDDFYAKLVDTPPEFTRMAYYRDVFVGVVGARVEALAASDGCAAAADAGAAAGAGASSAAGAGAGGAVAAGRRLYVMVLAVLAPYRSRGIGSALLRGALRAADESCAKTGITEVVLHSAEDNAEAIEFYSRFGFAVAGRAENYYRRLETSPHAVILRRPVPLSSI
jgi:ribosomal protein S18 acetylase RimI-like enzyme